MNDDDIRDELARELRGIQDPDTVRRDCAFCGRERTRADDNHAPDCAYWAFFRNGGQQ